MFNRKMARFFSAALSFALLAVPSYADIEIGLDESNNSEEYVEYEEHEYWLIEGSENNHTYDTQVFAQIGSTYKVTIPKVIVLSGVNKSADYQVHVEGDIAGYEVLHAVPDSYFYLSSKNKELQKADVVQTITSWRYDELEADTTGKVTANGITAGKWSGVFNFTIWLEGIEEERVLGDIILPDDLSDDYRLIIKKIGNKPGIYDEQGELIYSINYLVDNYNFDVSSSDGSTSSIINTYCPGATYVVLPGGTSSIGSNAFSGTSVSYVYIPNGVTSIGSNAFSPDIVYTNIPKSVTRIGSTPSGKVYYNNKQVRTIVVDLENNDSVDIELEKGCRYEITALYNFANNVTKESTIVSSNSNIVQFTPECYLDALELGNCVISGTYYTQDGREKYAEIKIKVKPCEDEYSSFPYVNTSFVGDAWSHLGYYMDIYERSTYSALSKNGHIVTELTLPATYTYEGKVHKITSLGNPNNPWLFVCRLEKLTLPDTITYLTPNMFSVWNDLKSISYKGVTYTDRVTFNNAMREYGITPNGDAWTVY